jgi:hypothetical protein
MVVILEVAVGPGQPKVALPAPELDGDPGLARDGCRLKPAVLPLVAGGEWAVVTTA